MLADFISTHRDEIILRTRALVSARVSPAPSEFELKNGIPVFLEQLAESLRVARSSDAVNHQQLTETAGRHGQDLLRMGLTVGQVVFDYGDVCQTISRLAVEQNLAISTDEFRTLNLCLDDAIAGAVTEYARSRDRVVAEQGTERLGTLAHELRNLLSIAMLSFESIKSGRVAVGGSTGLLHARTLLGLRDLIDRSLADVRLEAGIPMLARFSAAEMVEEVEIGAVLQAKTRGLALKVISVERSVTVEGDWPILAAAISNLLQNAFKFTRVGGTVTLTVRATEERVLFEVQDECGGLPPGKSEALFRPFVQQGDDRSGVGLGLAICRKAALANNGEVRVRDLPGQGCVFTLDLPRKSPPVHSKSQRL